MLLHKNQIPQIRQVLLRRRIRQRLFLQWFYPVFYSEIYNLETGLSRVSQTIV
jgi:hypothetical protein